MKKYIETERDKSWGKRISDGLFPQKLVKFLWNPIIPNTPFNGYTIVHFINGFLISIIFEKFYRVKFTWISAILLHTIWELFQFIIGDNKWEHKDVVYDILLDTAAFMLGWYLYNYLY